MDNKNELVSLKGIFLCRPAASCPLRGADLPHLRCITFYGGLLPGGSLPPDPKWRVWGDERRKLRVVLCSFFLIRGGIGWCEMQDKWMLQVARSQRLSALLSEWSCVDWIPRQKNVRNIKLQSLQLQVYIPHICILLGRLCGLVEKHHDEAQSGCVLCGFVFHTLGYNILHNVNWINFDLIWMGSFWQNKGYK